MAEKKARFEEKIEELEGIVTALENGEMPLDDMLKNFEKGIALARECSEVLDNAEKKITILSKKPDGTVREEKFAETE